MRYVGLRNIEDAAGRKRATAAIRAIRAGLKGEKGVPPKQPGSFLLATWNIRELGGTKYDERTPDALYCIAECISSFDLVAIQEVRSDLRELRKIMAILGPSWDVIFTDVSYAQGGNDERLAFVFDTSKVRFSGLAGELVLPDPSKQSKKETVVLQFARTPFVCGFQAGWAKFNLCTVHIYYGEGDQNARRVQEIERLSQLLAKKAEDYVSRTANTYSPENLILLGDFNIASKDHTTYSALTENGFKIPKGLTKLPGSNVAQDKFYDQIAFYREVNGIKQGKAGIFNFYNHVFNDEKVFKGFKFGSKGFKDWRTFQMSDHFIMWAQFDVDMTDTYLDEIDKWKGK